MSRYRVYITFDTGDQHLDTDWCDATDVFKSIDRLKNGPIGMMGVLKEIRVVDEGDCTAFLVQDGEVIYPSCENEEERYYNDR